jgi:hypothetical protein
MKSPQGARMRINPAFLHAFSAILKRPSVIETQMDMCATAWMLFDGVLVEFIDRPNTFPNSRARDTAMTLFECWIPISWVNIADG